MNVCVLQDVSNAVKINRFFLRLAIKYAYMEDMHASRCENCKSPLCKSKRFGIFIFQ